MERLLHSDEPVTLTSNKVIITQWRSCATWEFCDVPAFISTFLDALNDQASRFTESIKVYCADNQRVCFEFTLSKAYASNHEDLLPVLSKLFQGIRFQTMVFSLNLHVAVPLDQPALFDSLLVVLDLIFTHDPSKCISETCRRASFCASCERPFGDVQKESTCHSCDRSFCSECDAWFVTGGRRAHCHLCVSPPRRLVQAWITLFRDATGWPDCLCSELVAYHLSPC